MFKRASMVLLSVVLLTSLAAPCSASDNAFKDLYESALYGGLAGTLVGGRSSFLPVDPEIISIMSITVPTAACLSVLPLALPRPPNPLCPLKMAM